jgi:hypothetical protein
LRPIGEEFRGCAARAAVDIYTNNAEPFFSRMREKKFLFRKNRRERSQNHRLIRERRIKEDYPASSG